MKIFISYRHEDSQWLSLSLYKELNKKFREGNVFKDFDTIHPGDDFTKSIDNHLRSCDVLLVIIGKDWLNCKDEHGKRRLEKEFDHLRAEIESALRLGKKIVPVLTEDTRMPEEYELPESIRELHKKQSMRISSMNFDMDVFNLTNALYDVTGQKNPHSKFIKDFATGKIGEGDLEKPDSNAAFTLISFGVGILALIASDGETIILIVGFLLVVAGAAGLFLSSKVKKLWLNQEFEEARSNARRTKYLSIFAPAGGIVVMVIVGMLKLFGMINDPTYQGIRDAVEQQQGNVTPGVQNIAVPVENPPVQNIEQATTNQYNNASSAQVYNNDNIARGFITVSSYDYSRLLSKYGLEAEATLVIGNNEYILDGTDLNIEVLREGTVNYYIKGAAYVNGIIICRNSSSGSLNAVNNGKYYLCHDNNTPESECGFYLYTYNQFTQKLDAAEMYLQNQLQ